MQAEIYMDTELKSKLFFQQEVLNVWISFVGKDLLAGGLFLRIGRCEVRFCVACWSRG